MPAALYVLGHRNPDSDSICSAIGYAALLQAQGRHEAVAARQGVLRRETAFILQRFGVAPPVLVTDVRPRVADVMTTPPTVVHLETSLYEAGQLLQTHGVRVLPVVDDDGRLAGITGVEDFARTFLEGLGADRIDFVPLDLANVVRTLNGTMLVDAPERILRDRVMVGAMEVRSMVQRIEPDILLVMGDREDAQLAAIEVGVGALVVTGDHSVSDRVVALARERRVSVVSVPHHTYSTVRLIYLSAAVRHFMRTDVPTCCADDLLDDVREILRGGKVRSLVVIDGESKVQGIISRSSLLRGARRRLVLVDHNERGQSVAGIEEAEVVGVIDHHRVADFQTISPPFMRLEPLGSTSTIVGKLFQESGIAMPPPIAGVLLAGILADTLLFRGPTTTEEDKRIARDLAACAAVDMASLGTSILELASDVSDRSAAQLLTADFKDLSVDGSQFGIGVFETTNDTDVLAREQELVTEMARLRERGYICVMFAVIDIMRERTTLLISGHESDVAEVFDTTLEPSGHALRLPGIMSRKKQLVPLLGTIRRRIKDS